MRCTMSDIIDFRGKLFASRLTITAYGRFLVGNQVQAAITAENRPKINIMANYSVPNFLF